MLISPGDGLEVEVDQDNLEETVAFIWTAAIDEDNDPVEYWLNAEGLIGTDTVYGGAPDFHMEEMKGLKKDWIAGLYGQQTYQTTL